MSEKEQNITEEAVVEKPEAVVEKPEAVVEKPEAVVEKPEAVVDKPVGAEKKVESRKTSPKTSKPQNVVYIGNKPPMNYVMAVITAFNMGNGSEVTLKARGRAISTAIDVAEITRNRFLKDVEVHAISIGTEEITPREGGNPRNVSTLEINLKE